MPSLPKVAFCSPQRFNGLASTLAIASAMIAGSAMGQNLSGQIEADGSSTVFPITEAVAEAFGEENPDVRIAVGVSGTGGGFTRFAAREIDISDASRPIKASEAALCLESGVEYIEVPVAYDGLTIVVNKENDFIDQLTVDQLRLIYLANHQDTVTTWRDVDPSWPAEEIKIYAPGTQSGTYDYFKEVVAGKENDMRSDMAVSEDDNVLVNGVMGNEYAIGFFGCAYYFENEDNLRAVPIVNGDGDAVMPNPEAIEDGSYNPFARPLFIYVKTDALRRPEIAAFVEYFLDEGGELAEEVGYVRLPEEVTEAARYNVENLVTGTFYLTESGEPIHGPVTSVYTAGRE